jgi:hypothetical protein
MREIKALTHHHPKFLKEAYKHGRLKLYDTDRHFREGQRYIKFNPDNCRFCVYTHKKSGPALAGSFDNIVSAMFNA